MKFFRCFSACRGGRPEWCLRAAVFNMKCKRTCIDRDSNLKRQTLNPQEQLEPSWRTQNWLTTWLVLQTCVSRTSASNKREREGERDCTQEWMRTWPEGNNWLRSLTEWNVWARFLVITISWHARFDFYIFACPVALIYALYKLERPKICDQTIFFRNTILIPRMNIFPIGFTEDSGRPDPNVFFDHR